MPVVDASRLLEHAVRHRYAVCAFDIPDLAVLSATLAAAERARAPVILNPGSAGVAPPEHLLPALEAAARGAAIPVVLAQHGAASLAEAARAINHGCNALIIGTGESHSFATVARQCGIALITGAVEAELGAGESSYAGWLASGATVVIHAHLQDVAMPPTPTARYAAFLRTFHQRLEQEVATRLAWSRSAGQASAALAVAPPFHPVEHCIVYNVDSQHASRIDEVMEHGRRVLGAIPGVRAVFTGRAEGAGAKYQYCWIVRFAHPAVIDSYRDHPDHVGFANTHFRPIAPDRLTIDFRRVE